jgi:NTP pyrophosphatase (non-canonical NTP hydrolase)
MSIVPIPKRFQFTWDVVPRTETEVLLSESLDVGKVKRYLRAFAKERDWEQFHTPKNLAMALAGEAGELTEIFQWLTPEESARIMEDAEKREAVSQELADVLQYVIRLSDVLGIDIEQALWKKLKANSEKYPVNQAKGSARKYTDF